MTTPTPTPIRDSRNKGGTLTIGTPGVAYASQATNVRLVPSTDEAGDPLEVLSGATITADDVTTWALVIDVVQDFDNAAGFVNMTLTKANQLQAFTWKPNANGPTFSGTCKVRPVEIGGDVNKRLTTGAEFPMTGAPTVVYPTA